MGLASDLAALRALICRELENNDEQRWAWLVDDVPGTDDPEVARLHPRPSRRPGRGHDPEIQVMIEGAERLVVALERERAQSAA